MLGIDFAWDVSLQKGCALSYKENANGFLYDGEANINFYCG